MATYTEHYNFPKYEATDLPNLLDQYNNFADTADSQIYGMNSTVQAAQQAAATASSKADTAQQAATAASSKAEGLEDDVTELKTLVGESTGSGTVFEQLATLTTEVGSFDTDISGKAPTNHAASTTQYGAASQNNYGHVKIGQLNSSTVDTATVPSCQLTYNFVKQQVGIVETVADSAQSAAESAASDASTALTRANSAYNAINGGWDSVQNGNSGAIDWEVLYNDAAKLVMVAVNFRSSYPKATGDVPLGTIASSYRPSDTEMGVVAMVITGSNAFACCQAIVNSSGQLKLRFGGVGSPDFAFYSGNVYYPVS